MRWLFRIALLLAILCTLAFFYQSAASHSRLGDDAPVYSVRRHDPSGTAALYDLLNERGLAVTTLERPSLATHAHGVLVRILPAQSSRFDYQLRTTQLVDWIAAGNTVIELTRRNTELMSHFKIQPTSRPAGAGLVTVESFERSGGAPAESPAATEYAATTDGRKLALASPTKFATTQPVGWKPSARTTDDSAVAGEFSYGKGKLVLIGAPTPALNGTIDSAKNVDYLLGLLTKNGNNSVIIDEWSHGVGHEATVLGFLYDIGLIPVLAQLTLLAGLYVWSNAGMQSPDDIAVGRRPSSAEQIETLGFLYSRSLPPELTFARVQAEVERRTAEALRCRADEVTSHLSTLARSERGAALCERHQQMLAWLNDARPAKAVRCLGCGYDLRTNQTGACPECNKLIPVYQRNELAELSADAPSIAGRKASRPDSVYAEVLTFAHQLAQEISSERRTVR